MMADEPDISVLGLDEPLDNRGLYGFIADDDPDAKPLTVAVVQDLVRRFIFLVCDTRGKQASGSMTQAERTAEITQEAENLEQILYGNVAGWTATNWYDEAGLGRNLAESQDQTDPAGQVKKLLLYAAGKAQDVCDQMLTNEEFLGGEQVILQIADTAARWFHQVPASVMNKGPDDAPE
jgi:hypothetical protein